MKIFFKILKLSETDFYEYAQMVEGLSNYKLKFDWSIKQPAEKIQRFSIFFVWHSAFFNLFSYYSFIFLEFFYIFYYYLFFLK